MIFREAYSFNRNSVFATNVYLIINDLVNSDSMRVLGDTNGHTAALSYEPGLAHCWGIHYSTHQFKCNKLNRCTQYTKVTLMKHNKFETDKS